MKELQVRLRGFSDVERFVACTSRQPFPLHAASGNKVTNAKSLIGLFSLDLRWPVTVRVEDDQADLAPFLEEIRPFLL